MRNILSLIVVCLLLFAGALSGYAQEATPEAPVIEQPVVPVDADIEAAGTAIVKAVADVVTNSPYVVVSMTIITSIVSLLKLVPATKHISAPLLNLAVQVIFWTGGVLLARAGYSAEFNHWIGVFSEPVNAFSGLIISLFGSSVIHNQAADKNIPLLGYKRTPYR